MMKFFKKEKKKCVSVQVAQRAWTSFAPSFFFKKKKKEHTTCDVLAKKIEGFFLLLKLHMTHSKKKKYNTKHNEAL